MKTKMTLNITVKQTKPGLTKLRLSVAAFFFNLGKLIAPSTIDFEIKPVDAREFRA